MCHALSALGTAKRNNTTLAISSGNCLKNYVLSWFLIVKLFSFIDFRTYFQNMTSDLPYLRNLILLFLISALSLMLW